MSKHSLLLRCLFPLVPLICCSTAWAMDLDRQAALWASSCVTCHTASSKGMPPIPPLAGRETNDIVTRMQSFVQPAAPATLMAQIARGYSDTEIVRIAQWFARQPVATQP